MKRSYKTLPTYFFFLLWSLQGKSGLSSCSIIILLKKHIKT
ncbi:hypothetical protein P301_D15391 [Saccharomyces cerevisiae P301]|nr:hypothetical protein P301_D15391 [Saccharomyces cerevisiae P301]